MKPHGVTWVYWKLECGHFAWGTPVAVKVHCTKCNSLQRKIREVSAEDVEQAAVS